MGLIHILVRPYANAIHNILDEILLQLIVIISVLPIVEIVDNYDETFVVVNAYLLVATDKFYCRKVLDKQEQHPKIF